MEKLIKVHLDRQEYTSKPEGYDIGTISKRITRAVAVLEPKELAEDIALKGKTVLLGIMKDGSARKKNNFQAQQVIMIDVDNNTTVELPNGSKKIVKATGSDYIPMSQMLNDTFIKQNASFMYKTFSYKADHEKYRIVFILDKEVTESYIIEGIYKKLIIKYPFIDASCKDTTRLFFGGNELVEINYDNELKVSSIVNEKSLREIQVKEINSKVCTDDLTQVLQQATSKGTVAESMANINPNLTESLKPTYQLILEGNDEEVRDRLKPYGDLLNQYEIDSVETAYMFLSKLNLRDVLGLPSTGTFLDIFHEENNPSASIIQLDNGTYVYKCFSDSAEFTGGDIALVVGNILKTKDLNRKGFGKTYIKPKNGIKFNAVHYLVNIMGIVIVESEELKDLKRSIDFAISEFHSPALEYNYKETYKIIKNHIMEITELLRIFKENVTIDLTTKQPRLISWIGNRTLAKSIYNTDKISSKQIKINKVTNLLALIGIVFKLDYTDIPEDLKVILEQVKKKNEYSRYVAVYEVKLIKADFMEGVNEICKKLVSYNFTVSQNMNRTSLINIMGKDIADKIYPQDKNFTVNHKLEKLKIPFFRELLPLIEEYGYVPENYIKNLIKEEYPELGFTDKAYQNIKIILPDYGVKKIRLSKELKLDERALNFYSISKQGFPSILTLAD